MRLDCTILCEKCSDLLHAPLDAVASKKTGHITKIVSYIAIGILTGASLGYYAVHARTYLAEKRLSNLKGKVHNAVLEGNAERIKKLVEKHPELKKAPRNQDEPNGERFLADQIPLAAEKGYLEVVQLLHGFGAHLNALSRCSMTALDRAIRTKQLDVVTYLFDNGASFTADDFTKHLFEDELTLDIIQYLVGKVDKLSSENKRWSCIGMCATYWNDNPEKCKEVIRQMIQKGDRPVKTDEKMDYPQEARDFIASEVQAQITLAGPPPETKTV